MARNNSIELAAIFQKELDKEITHSLVTGWMDANAGNVIYNGGKEIKIPVMNVDGLANYGRADGSGFVNGQATVAYKTFEMTQDRGRAFTLDRHDVDESNYAVTMGGLLGEFQRTRVVPEVDAYRISKCIKAAMTATNAEYSATLTKANIVNKFKSAVTTIRENGCTEELIAHISYTNKQLLEEAMIGSFAQKIITINGVDTRVDVFDGVILIPTPSLYMVSEIELNDGVTGGQEAGGFKKKSDAKACNFVIMAKSAPLAVTKQDKVRTFTPDENQTADAWKSDYRRYHDCFITENKAKNIFASIPDAE